MSTTESTRATQGVTGWLIFLALSVIAVLVISLIDWRSEAGRLAERIDVLDFERIGEAETYNHLLPADLAEREPSFEFQSDTSPQIDGEETTMASYAISSGLSVASYAYDGHVWGYLLSTDRTSIAIVDSDNDGSFDRLYRSNQPVYIPDWVIEIAAGR